MKSKTFVPLLILCTTFVILMIGFYLGGPRSANVPLAALTIDQGVQSATISGKQFQCDGTDPHMSVINCTTELNEQRLQVSFSYSNERQVYLATCIAQYDQQSFACTGYYDYRGGYHQPYIKINDNLGLTEADLWEIRLSNPMANVAETNWPTLLWFPAIFLAVLVGLTVWTITNSERMTKKTVTAITSITTVVAIFPAYWLMMFVALFTGHVD